MPANARSQQQRPPAWIGRKRPQAVIRQPAYTKPRDTCQTLHRMPRNQILHEELQ
jgi:hypothetical protein